MFEVKIEEHVKKSFVGGNWNHNALGFVNLFSKPKNVKHIIGSIIYIYMLLGSCDLFEQKYLSFSSYLNRCEEMF